MFFVGYSEEVNGKGGDKGVKFKFFWKFEIMLFKSLGIFSIVSLRF